MFTALEGQEWMMIDWWNADEAGKPRVLLIGDSITNGYGARVKDLLLGTCFTGRLATSKCVGSAGLVKEIDYALSQFEYAAIHFNNGLHGWDCPEKQFAKEYAKVVAHIQKKAPEAQLLLAASTSMRNPADLAQVHAVQDRRVVERNASMRACAEEKGLPFNDLYTLSVSHGEWYSTDAVHFNAEGYQALAGQVARMVGATLSRQ